jgi:hypothetical protein
MRGGVDRMREYSGEIYNDVKKCVDEVIEYVGKDIVMAMTLALGNRCCS